MGLIARLLLNERAKFDRICGELHTISKLLVELSNHTRLWSNNGHTPSELAGRPPVVGRADHKSKKIGRNDPCPCGSGKKYKRCCGR